METQRIDVTETWQQVVADGEDYTIQNISNGIVEVGFGEGGTLPPDDPAGITGIVLTKYKGISFATFGYGDIYVKGAGTQIIVSK